MLSIYSFKRRPTRVVTMIFAILAVAMTAQSANAQEVNTIEHVRNTLRRVEFNIVTRGCGWSLGRSGYVLTLSVLEDNVTLVGKVYSVPGARPIDDNVRGSITVSGWGRTFSAKVSFTVAGQVGGGILVGGMNFEGAIRFLRNGDFKAGEKTADRIFMAGTFTYDADGITQIGPFPFFADH